MPTPRDFVKHDPIAAALRVLLDVCRRMDGEARQARRGEESSHHARSTGDSEMTTLIAQGPVDVNVSRCTVRVKTTVWADKRGLHTKKSLTFLRRQCEGFNILAEDISAMGVEEVLPRIVNLDKVKDGIYEVVVRDKSYDYETGYVDDYDYRLVTANAALTGAEGVRVEGTVMQHNDERSCDV